MGLFVKKSGVEEPAKCETCGVLAELRPYGSKGENICVVCASKDPAGLSLRVEATMRTFLTGATHVVGPQGQIIKLGDRAPGNA
jgi:hypothetical protein